MHIKMMEELVVPFRDLKRSFGLRAPLRVLSINTSTAEAFAQPFRALSQQNMAGKLVTKWRKKMPCHNNKTASRRGSFQHFRQALSSFLYGTDT